MASLHKRKKSPFYWAAFTLPDGRRVFRSTKTADRKTAQKLLAAMTEATERRATADQVQRILSDVHESIHGTPLITVTLADYARQFLERKKDEAAAVTLASYKGIIADFIETLGEKANQPISYITKADNLALVSAIFKNLTSGDIKIDQVDNDRGEYGESSETPDIEALSERLRGCLQEGEELPTIARGPLSLMDTMGFLVGCGRGHTHGVVLQAAVKHPGHFFRNPEAGGGVEYTGIGHHRESVAKDVGVPGTYDYGPQRSSWMCSLVTNWMGDAGVLKRIRTEMRRFNIMGDTTFCKGKVVRKYVKDNTGLVDIEIAAENQRGELTTPSFATVALPSRNVNLPVFIDGSGVNLDLPLIR
jgi:hypothetical protein